MIKRAVLLGGLVAVLAISLFLTSRPLRQRIASSPRSAVEGAIANSAPAVRPAVGQLPVASTRSNSIPQAQIHPATREFDPVLNPYADALREPGKSSRAWDAGFMKSLNQPAAGSPIRFELTAGRIASGNILMTQFRDGELSYVSGELTEPEQGKFFFLTPPPGGKAGKAVGVIEFPASQTAYRIEPTGPGGDPELWQRRLDEVLCLNMARLDERAATNEMENIPPLRPDLVPSYVPSYNSNIVSLQSYPGSSAVLLLDFFGGYTATWGGVSYAKPNVSNDQIKDVWKRVAEDFMAFNINVTTDVRVYQNAPISSRQKCVFTVSSANNPLGAGGAGVAYVGSWNWGSDTVCWSGYVTGKASAEVGAHEPGHTLGLSHETTDIGGVHTEYFTGQGSGATGWAPIMGAGYYQPVTTFAKGEYQYAGNLQDQMNIIATQNNAVAYRPDDTGSTLATSRYLEIYPDLSTWAEGVIERAGDTDAFQFTTTGGQVFLSAKPVGDWANLALMATLADASDTIIVSNNPQAVLSASIKTNLPGGTYTFRVTGAGRNDPLTNGFSAYDSLGYYAIGGSVAGGRLPTRLGVIEHVPNGTVVGTVPASNTNDTLAYVITAGNTGSTFAVDSNGVFTVANNTLLDYARLATNSMRAVQFELFANITDLSNPSLTETNRRVVIAVQNSAANYPIAATGFNAGVIVPYNATASVPKAVGFDIANRYCFYQAGLDGNAQVSGSGGAQGFPANGTVVSALDGSTFQLGPYGGNNVLLLGNTYASSGTLTLVTPQAYNSLAIIASSANGGGLGTFVLRFTNGTTSQVFSLNAQDWFGTVTNVALQGFGRLALNGGLQTEDNSWANPNLYQTTLNLAALGINQPISSITFTKPSGGSTLNSGIFGLSGMVMPPTVNIAQQPQSSTNSVGGSTSSFSVVAMGTPPLGYQWYGGTPAYPTFLSGQTGSTLTVTPTPVNQVTNYFVVVTNNLNAVTSVVASLTVYRAPVITRQPAPTNLVLFATLSNGWSVAANAATPLNYYWTLNGTPLAGPTTSKLALPNLQATNAGNYAVQVSNVFGSVTSVIVSLGVISVPNNPYVQTVLADRAMAYWRLNETSGTVARDSAGPYNGQYVNVILNQAGYNPADSDKAARFGSPTVNSYVGSIPLDFATPGGNSAAFSIEAWVKGNAQTTDAGIVTRGTGGGGEQFNLDTGAGGHAFRFFVRDAGGGAHLANGTNAPNGAWHHVVGVCDQPNGNVLLYVDGISNASSTISPAGGLLSSANATTIGSRQSGTGNYDNQFIGTLDEVAIYNYALSPVQVQTHWAVRTNLPPLFTANPLNKPNANAGQPSSSSLAANANDPNGDALTFSKTSGPAWLSLAANGALSGTPADTDSGTNSFIVRVTDPGGLFASATMYVYVNGTPSFTSNLFTMPPADAGQTYSATMASFATDPNPGDLLTFAKVSGPAWLAVAANGGLSGTPFSPDAGTNNFVMSVTDSGGLSNIASMNITVRPAPPLNAAVAAQSPDSLLLSWAGGIGPFQVQMTTNLINPAWQNVGPPLSTNQLGVIRSNSAAFYRILGQ